MNDGVKILLERMQTHPEEFHGEYNRWSDLIHKFEKFFNVSERALINGALTNIRRNEFTGIVMQELLREPTPVEIDPNTYTINTAGRALWGATALSTANQSISDYMRLEMQKLQVQAETTKTKAEKNKSKMEQLLQAVTKKKRTY